MPKKGSGKHSSKSSKTAAKEHLKDILTMDSHPIKWVQELAADPATTLKQISTDYFHKTQVKVSEDEIKEFTKNKATGRNRYGNIPCLDKTRVVLRKPRDGNDYIHANWVKSSDKRCKFILTQAPLPETMVDFWSMCWEENVFLIICLTKIIEKGQLKTHEYWPTICGREHYQKHGAIYIRSQGVRNEIHGAMTLLDCVHQDTKESRKIKHFLYLDWPDHRVPACTHNFLQLTNYIDEEITDVTSENEPTVLIHCSAGVGRSGTLVALHELLTIVQTGEKPCVPEALLGVRKQRAMAVQGEEQYMFLHWALIMFILNNSSITLTFKKEMMKRLIVMRNCSTKSQCSLTRPIEPAIAGSVIRGAKREKRKKKKQQKKKTDDSE